MKFFGFVILFSYLFSSRIHGEQITEIYPGSLIKRELVAVHSNPFVVVSFFGILDGRLSFAFKAFDRRVFEETPVYEKLKVVREREDLNDSGLRSLVPGEYITGAVEKREEIEKIGPVSFENFQYFGVTSRTDRKGILVDDQQVVLSQFENLRRLSVLIKFESKEYGVLELNLSRSELYDELGIHYGTTQKSHPENLKFEANWGSNLYTPGSTAKLFLTVANTGDVGDIYRVLARSISRWHWLDGKMYYIGDLKPGEEKQLMRILRIPDNVLPGTYYLRIGFNDHSGSKPQLPLTIDISQP